MSTAKSGLEEGGISLQEISIIIPVKDNQEGIDRMLDAFFDTHTATDYPGEIIIVDNNSKVPVAIADRHTDAGLKINLLQCTKPGPACARNFGAKQANGAWMLFVDSDCIPTGTMIKGYLSAEEGAVGYQGFVGALGKDYVSRYYESQQIHQPFYKEDTDGNRRPKYLVTANVLVGKKAFYSVGGFDETYVFAGEDVDFGTRLSKIGELAYAKESMVLHNYHDGFWGFVVRFVKYGKGNRLVQQKLKIPLYPLPFTAKEKTVLINNFLAIVQWSCLLSGYLLKSFELAGRRRK